jgi:hypothetical protein
VSQTSKQRPATAIRQSTLSSVQTRSSRSAESAVASSARSPVQASLALFSSASQDSAGESSSANPTISINSAWVSSSSALAFSAIQSSEARAPARSPAAICTRASSSASSGTSAAAKRVCSAKPRSARRSASSRSPDQCNISARLWVATHSICGWPTSRAMATARRRSDAAVRGVARRPQPRPLAVGDRQVDPVTGGTAQLDDLVEAIGGVAGPTGDHQPGGQDQQPGDPRLGIPGGRGEIDGVLEGGDRLVPAVAAVEHPRPGQRQPRSRPRVAAVAELSGPLGPARRVGRPLGEVQRGRQLERRLELLGRRGRPLVRGLEIGDRVVEPVGRDADRAATYI